MARGQIPSLSCKGCSQGFHQACYDRLEIGDSLAELPGMFSWVCSVCAPHYILKTVVGGRKVQEKPRQNKRGPVTEVADEIPLSDIVSDTVAEGDDAAPAALAGPAVPPLVPLAPPQPQPVPPGGTHAGPGTESDAVKIQRQPHNFLKRCLSISQKITK